MVKDFSSPRVVSHKYSHIPSCCLNKIRCLSTFYLDVTYCTTSDLLQTCYTSCFSSIDQLQDETIFSTEKCNKSCQTQAWKLGKGQCHMKSTPLPASWWTKHSIAWRHHVFFLRSYLGCGVYHFYHSFHNPNAIETIKNYNYNYTTTVASVSRWGKDLAGPPEQKEEIEGAAQDGSNLQVTGCGPEIFHGTWK